MGELSKVRELLQAERALCEERIRGIDMLLQGLDKMEGAPKPSGHPKQRKAAMPRHHGTVSSAIRQFFRTVDGGHVNQVVDYVHSLENAGDVLPNTIVCLVGQMLKRGELKRVSRGIYKAGKNLKPA